MTFRSSEDARLRAVDALAGEAADQELPAFDWETIEAKLFAELQSSAVPMVAPRAAPARDATSATSPWAVAVSAAAAAFLIFASQSPVSRSPAASALARATPTATTAGGIIPLLEVGDTAESTSQSLAYQKDGLVSFTLAPESRIDVVAIDPPADTTPGPMTVALARGSIHADVTPRPHGEVFAVEVGSTRIAVHGTSFTVTREDDRVIVDVAHGSVAVGPTGHPGETHGWLVVGPDRAAFSLDGAKAAQWLARPSAEIRADIESNAVAGPAMPEMGRGLPSSRKTAALPGQSSGLSRGASASTVQKLGDSSDASQVAENRAATEGIVPAAREQDATSAILKQLAICYERQPTASGVRFSVESALTLTVLANGVIREGVFLPPLSPTLMFCAEQAIGAVRFPRGDAVRHIRVPVTLSRSP